jgi:hypothetical protein
MAPTRSQCSSVGNQFKLNCYAYPPLPNSRGSVPAGYAKEAGACAPASFAFELCFVKRLLGFTDRFVE